jgi:hypothetical protein
MYIGREKERGEEEDSGERLEKKCYPVSVRVAVVWHQIAAMEQ